MAWVLSSGLGSGSQLAQPIAVLDAPAPFGRTIIGTVLSAMTLTTRPPLRISTKTRSRLALWRRRKTGHGVALDSSTNSRALHDHERHWSGALPAMAGPLRGANPASGDARDWRGRGAPGSHRACGRW